MKTGTSASHRLLTAMGALLGAAALSLLTESAIARMVGPDILLPFQAGRFLPGRMAREGAALVLCLALALTERGRSLSARLTAALEKDRYCWLASAVVTGLFIAWTWRVTVFSFMTSDESGLLRSVVKVNSAGFRSAANTYSHVLFCWLLSLPYRLDPNGSWYTLYQLAAMAVSLTVIGRCVLRRTGARHWSVWAGVAIHALLCAGVFMYSFALIAYTVTAAIVGSASVALLLCREDVRSRAGRLASDAGSVILLLLCVMERWETGESVLCFWLLAAAYQAVRLLWSRREKSEKRRLLSLGGCVLVAAGLVVGLRLLAQSELVGYRTSYMEDDASRTLIVDFLADDLSEEDYAQVGIPPELATLMRSWYFMDRRVTTETLDALADAYYARRGGESLGQLKTVSSLRSYCATLADQVRGDPQMLWRALCLTSLLGLTAGAVLAAGKRRWPELLCAMCAVAGAGVLLLYLVVQGRFLTRAFLVAVLPAIVTVLLMALAAEGRADALTPGRRTAAMGLAGLFAAGAVVCCCMGVYHVPHIRDTATSDDLFGVQRATDAYMNAHPDTLFITNLFDNNLDPFRSPDYPTNTTFWGNRGDISKAPENRRFTEAFFQDDVRFMTDNPTAVVLLLQYMTLDQGPVQAATMDKLPGGVCSYAFSRIQPEHDGWYEQNGMTYYFQNGNALTGEQIVDGERCVFAPVGSQAAFSVAPGQYGMIYLTDAYSLTGEGE